MSDEAEQPIEDDSWSALRDWLQDTGNLVEVTETDDAAGSAALASLEGAGEETALGAIVRHVGAITVDDWLVLLGAGAEGVPGIRDVNGRVDGALEAIPGALVVAIDRLGGGFVLNGGGLPEGEVGEICYLAPDDLEWMPCGFGYTALLEWAFDGDVEGFYADLRWASWREESAVLGPGRAFNAYPPPWVEGGEDLSAASRTAVPLQEAWAVVLAASLRRGNWAPAGGD
ncbi:MAG: DUF2625 family protein [Solirubrobacteraceae bacterium]|nr:DUF2625 family protein [Solirubrobacteraceae bacterium]